MVARVPTSIHYACSTHRWQRDQKASKHIHLSLVLIILIIGDSNASWCRDSVLKQAASSRNNSAKHATSTSKQQQYILQKAMTTLG
jgi:hypothetical protein